MKQSLFSKQIKANPKAHELSIGLAMVGINVNIMTAELILEAQSTMKKMGDKFDLKTASRIQVMIHEKYEKIHSDIKKSVK